MLGNKEPQILTQKKKFLAHAACPVWVGKGSAFILLTPGWWWLHPIAVSVVTAVTMGTDTVTCMLLLPGHDTHSFC